jgi:predicted AlkP superfamily phosphohydrolase/phosphomutase
MRRKTIVIGLDGGSYNLIDELVENGHLPHIAKIYEKGVKTKLESSKPPVTSHAWKVFSTGLNPGKLGIYWWRQLNRGDFSTISSGGNYNFDKKNIWDYFTDAGIKSAMVGTPLTYPPYPINGYYVAGGPYSKDKDFTYPEELEIELIEELDYKVNPEISVSGPLTEERKKEVKEVIESKFRAGKYILENEEIEFLNISTFFLNVVQHHWWGEESLTELWELIDEYIGDLMKSGCNLLIISDHGMTECKREFYLGSWLTSQGYTKIKSPDQQQEALRNRAYSIAKSIKNEVYIPDHLLNIGRKFFSSIGAESKPRNTVNSSSTYEDKIDYNSSKAVGFPQGNIYLINCEGEKREKLREEIKEELENLTDNGNKVVKKVYYREDIYSGEYVEKAPDLYVEPAEGYRIRQGEVENVENKEFFTDAPTDGSDWKATNHPDGILMGYGPDISNNSNFEAKLQDIAPTVLHMHGISIPEEMDGRVLTELFKPESEAGERDPKREKISIKKNDSRDDLVQDLDI